ncbi:unnamed protein product [Linum trigynum]|uniref:Uncharacterized protein n=1 Tax=Linum trigynum TaxID=586398 RepID=A0AAV2DQC1_9ROSI
MVKYLKINGRTFGAGNNMTLETRVAKFLKGRPDEISFEFSSEQTDIEIFEELMKCAAGHGLLNLWVRGSREFMDLSGRSDTAFGSITHCGPSLEYLELEEFKFNRKRTFGQSCSGFRALTALYLIKCCFDFSRWKRLDPFAHFPALQRLTLIYCSCQIGDDDRPDETRCLEINGDQLFSLEIDQPVGFTEIKVSAEKLSRFTYKHQIPDNLRATEVSLNAQSLSWADIELLGYKRLVCDEQRKRWAQVYANLFHGLGNVLSLVVKFDTTKALFEASKLVRDQPSPFRKLESMTLRSEEEDLTVIPQYVMDYFFGSNESMNFIASPNVILISKR